jgi:aminocarboxymuconate-semialdehyde decarboxylase
MLKIDIFNHIWPVPFFQALQKVVPNFRDMGKRVTSIPMLMDLELRFRVMDRFDDYVQILSMSSPPLEAMAPDPATAQELVRIANDSVAEICVRYPDRFPGFIAILASNNPQGMIDETRRAIEDLGAVGVLLYSNAAGRPIDGPEFEPLYAMMERYDRPIWIHPTRTAAFADYQTESKSKYEIWWTLGWPYETTVAMSRLVFSGVLDRYPALKVITHHGGGIAPMLEGRLGPGWDQLGTRTSDEDYVVLLKSLHRRPLDYFRLFYADTALFGSAGATRLALEFFGPQHFLFASDSPFDPEQGPMYIRETIRILEALEVTDAERARIFHGNAIELLGLAPHAGGVRAGRIATV